jgi:hypothetical protein
LKPDFWSDESIVALSDSAKLMFQGLWNLADREGRIEDKPLTIGFKVRPWDPQSAPALLAELTRAELIVRYEVAGVKCIGVPGLTKHQRIHPKEMASKLPDWNDKTTGREKVELSTASQGKIENYASLSEPAGPSGSSEEAPRKKRAVAPPPADFRSKTDALCADFDQVVRSKYVWNGERDTSALKRLLAAATFEEVRARWRKGLELGDKWPGVRTVGQLALRWNDLAAAGSPPATESLSL